MEKYLSLLVIVLLGSCGQSNEVEETRLPQEESTITPVLEGQPNFRDLGGYETTDGRVVKSGAIYRSGELSHITEDDLRKLDSMHIATVINFLTVEEIELKGQDILPEGSSTISLPLNSGDMAMEAQRSVKSGDFENIPPDQNAMFHQVLGDEKAADYGQLIRELNATEGPTVFHCSHGVHRTGNASAIVLSLLGVPWETVREEYLLTNEYRKEEVEVTMEKTRMMVAKNKGIDPSEVDMTNIEAFYVLEASYIDALRNYVMEEYGSFENYAIEAMGLTTEDINTLKSKYLN